jgi:hypothetical protein
VRHRSARKISTANFVTNPPADRRYTGLVDASTSPKVIAGKGSPGN